MDAARRLWAWLSNSKNQKTLGFIGGGIVVVVGAGWQVYIHFYPSKSSIDSVQPTQVIEQHVEEGGTAIVQTGEGRIYITKGISPENFQSLAEELGITQVALRNFFDILEEKDVPLEEYDNVLRKIAKSYKELQEELERFSSSDPAVIAFKKEAREALAKFDFQETEALLKKAVDRDIEAAKQLNEIAEERMLSAAASMAEIGRLKEIQVDYKEAASYFRQASDSVPKGKDLVLAVYLGNWGVVSLMGAQYEEAENPLIRSLEIHEKALGPDHPDVATCLNNLAGLYKAQGRYAEAEPFFKRALAIQEEILGKDHHHLVPCLNNLADLYGAQGRYAEAEPLYKRALTISEKALGPEHPYVAKCLHNLAGLYYFQGRYSEAEPLLRRAPAILEKALGPDHPEVAKCLNNLGELYRDEGRYGEAEPFFKRALAIQERSLGENHPNLTAYLNNLAALYGDQGRYAEAEPLYKRALAIREKTLGKEHPEVALSLYALGVLSHSQAMYAEAEPLLKRALAILEKALGPDHPLVGMICQNMAECYQEMGKEDDADRLEARAKNIRSKR